MSSYSPLQIALLIVAGLSVVGVIVAFVRSQMMYHGYSEIMNDVRRLGLATRGDIFRDRGDVVVSGSYERRLVSVRFSNDERTPGMNIRMQAPAAFLMSVVPADAQVSEGGRHVVKTEDEQFDVRFTVRTDQPTDAEMFINKQTTKLLQQLACSKHSFISLGNGAIEVSELLIPTNNTLDHVVEHLSTMAKLGEALRSMPGSDQVKLVSFERKQYLAARVAVVVGILVAVLSVFAATRVPSREPVTGINQTLSSGILPADAPHIANAQGWHAAAVEEMDAAAVNWLRANNQQPSARVQGDFTGHGNGLDVVYLLVSQDGSRRIVLLADNETRYDTKFPYVGLAARVPKSALNSIQWVGGKTPEGIDGDGILLVRQQDNAASGIVLFLSGRTIVSATPVNYQSIRLE